MDGLMSETGKQGWRVVFLAPPLTSRGTTESALHPPALQLPHLGTEMASS